MDHTNERNSLNQVLACRSVPPLREPVVVAPADGRQSDRGGGGLTIAARLGCLKPYPHRRMIMQQPEVISNGVMCFIRETVRRGVLT